MIWGGYCKEKLDDSHSYGSKGSNLMWTLFILSSMETSNNCAGDMDSWIFLTFTCTYCLSCSHTDYQWVVSQFTWSINLPCDFLNITVYNPSDYIISWEWKGWCYSSALFYLFIFLPLIPLNLPPPPPIIRAVTCRNVFEYSDKG